MNQPVNNRRTKIGFMKPDFCTTDEFKREMWSRMSVEMRLGREWKSDVVLLGIFQGELLRIVKDRYATRAI